MRTLTGLIILSLSILPSLAQQADTLSLAEVSVTAIKQSASLLRDPVAVTILDAKPIERLNIQGMKDMTDIAPNFYMPEYGSRMTASVYVRGIGARIDQPAVGLNVDNVPYLNKNGFDFDMLDIQRIEVLRGPQSTLYGRNTIAGLINVYTLSPLAWQGVRVMAEGSLPGAGRAGAGVYHRFSPKVGMSVNGMWSRSHGWQRNLHTGRMADAANDLSGRWKTVLQPSEALSIENVLSANRSRQQGYPYTYAVTGTIDYNDPCHYRRTSVTDGLTVRWTRGSLSLASITGYQFLHDDMMLDQDFLSQSYFTLRQQQLDRSITQDLVLRGHHGGYSWLAGVFGFYKYGSMDAPVNFKRDGIDNLILPNIRGNMPSFIQLDWDGDNFVLGSEFRHHVRGAAIYHQSTYDWRHLSFALSVRYEFEQSALRYHSYCSTGVHGTVNMPQIPRPITFALPADIDIADRMRQNFRQLLPKASITYNLTNSAIYASVAKGYKAGGFNTQMFSNFLQQRLTDTMRDEAMQLMGNMMGGMGGGQGARPAAEMPGQTTAETEYSAADYVSYRPETSWNYEIGGHFSCDGGRVYSTLTAFLIDVRDQQITVFPEGTSTGRMMTNAGRTRSAGAELSIRYSPTSRWQFDLSYGYTHATFRHFFDGRQDLSGRHVPYAPSNTLYLAASHRLPIRGCTWADALSFTADVRGTGRIYWDEENLYHQPFYVRLGASVRLEHSRYSVDLWGKNLTDTRYNVFRYESIGNQFYQRGRGISGGITLRVKI